MDNREMAKKLGSLVQLDIDAVHAYQAAIDKIDHPLIRETMIRFREDHDRHITTLSAAIRQAGESPPEYSPDFKGFLIQGFTSMRSITGTEGALKAMHTNEKLTNKTYDDARGWDLPASVKDLVRSAFEDEQRHIAYIEKTLEEKAWEKPGPEKTISGA
jgi:rubrerythrin